ncbi:LacI family DNA-binding transcriptional regulator [Bacillus sp. 1P06AnD]|uniref:LacI family DNA-binding transcriptional regulator n=1 Tax=Bacillus sp. 1P06AnD TaxID=3132208 RepID=UPI0039A179C9
MKKSTIKDVARVSNFSIATVSRVLNGKGNVSPEIAKKVLDVAEQLQYVPNQLAKGLKDQKTNLVGMVVPDMQDPYFLQVIQRLEQKLQPLNIHLILAETFYNEKKEREVLQQLEAKRVDSILIASAGGNEKGIAELVVKGIQVVLFHTKIKVNDIKIPQISEDEEANSSKLTTMLLDEGHQLIGVINGSKTSPNAIEKYVGYVKAMYTGGEVLDSAYTFEGSYSIESGRKAVKRFLSLPKRPTAILSLHPYFTIGAIAELNKQKIRIPRDVTIASLGGDPSFALLEDKGLLVHYYSVEMDVEEILFHLNE